MYEISFNIIINYYYNLLKLYLLQITYIIINLLFVLPMIVI